MKRVVEPGEFDDHGRAELGRSDKTATLTVTQ